ncbi:MAG: NAD(P)/FAD-dependent oxidoreductase [Geodermatophilaceae bacterium]|nr:NAD(P)/FAD-dependent oxidoreductase [Geodermatophilaceae bacterium]
MTGSQEYDVVVIGAGAVGENAADRVVQAGLSAALVESDLIGGECSYWACMPSKALLRGSEILSEAQAVPGAAEAITGTQDVAKTLERRDGFTSNWSDEGQAKWVAGAGIELFRGTGRLAGSKRVEVQGMGGETTTLTARQAVVVATGSQAMLPPIDGLAQARPWTSREATSAQAAPKRLVVIGGGVVGVEMATAWRALGSEVTLLVRGPQLLSSMEPFAGELVAAGLGEMGVDIRTEVEVDEVTRDGAVVTVRFADESIDADEVLVATGRTPRTSDLGLDTIGLEPGDSLEIDDTCRVTSVDGGWLYATGDVNGRRLLTHMGKYQARACGSAIAARARGEQVDGAAWEPTSATADHGATPSVIFSSPTVAWVGRTEEEARKDGMKVRAVSYDIGNVAGGSLYADGYTGTAKIVVDEERRILVGATFVGPGVQELLHSATVAIVGEVTIDRLWHAVPSYPTISEVWLRLLETYGL